MILKGKNSIESNCKRNKARDVEMNRRLNNYHQSYSFNYICCSHSHLVQTRIDNANVSCSVVFFNVILLKSRALLQVLNCEKNWPRCCFKKCLLSEILRLVNWSVSVAWRNADTVYNFVDISYHCLLVYWHRRNKILLICVNISQNFWLTMQQI